MDQYVSGAVGERLLTVALRLEDPLQKLLALRVLLGTLGREPCAMRWGDRRWTVPGWLCPE